MASTLFSAKIGKNIRNRAESIEKSHIPHGSECVFKQIKLLEHIVLFVAILARVKSAWMPTAYDWRLGGYSCLFIAWYLLFHFAS